MCTGTGDLAFALYRRVTASGRAVGVDFAENMLDHARAKAAERGEPVEFVQADALALPFADDEFDGATVAFGIRNVSDLDGGIAEMARVVRPGGRVVILEITTPRHLRRFYQLWFDRVVPLLGTLLVATVPRTGTCRRRSSGFRSHRSSRVRWPTRGWATCAGSCLPGASSPCTMGEYACECDRPPHRACGDRRTQGCAARL